MVKIVSFVSILQQIFHILGFRDVPQISLIDGTQLMGELMPTHVYGLDLPFSRDATKIRDWKVFWDLIWKRTQLKTLISNNVTVPVWGCQIEEHDPTTKIQTGNLMKMEAIRVRRGVFLVDISSGRDSKKNLYDRIKKIIRSYQQFGGYGTYFGVDATQVPVLRNHIASRITGPIKRYQVSSTIQSRSPSQNPRVNIVHECLRDIANQFWFYRSPSLSTICSKGVLSPFNAIVSKFFPKLRRCHPECPRTYFWKSLFI